MHLHAPTKHRPCRKRDSEIRLVGNSSWLFSACRQVSQLWLPKFTLVSLRPPEINDMNGVFLFINQLWILNSVFASIVFYFRRVIHRWDRTKAAGRQASPKVRELLEARLYRTINSSDCPSRLLLRIQPCDFCELFLEPSSVMTGEN